MAVKDFILSFQPIIYSLLDIDFYKFTMGQLVFHKHPDVKVRYELTNRTNQVKLAEEIDLEYLRAQLDHVRTLKFTEQEVAFLRQQKDNGHQIFKEDYLEFLSEFQLPEYFLDVVDGQLSLGTDTDWAHGIYWETIMLSIVSEIRTDTILDRAPPQEKVGWSEGQHRLDLKIDKLIEAKNRGMKISLSDFGTRRRASGDWQRYVVNKLEKTLTQNGIFQGTSNVKIAHDFLLNPIGTNAHELPMVYSGIYHEEDDAGEIVSQQRVLSDWEEEYPSGKLLIALPDTFGSEFFFIKVFTEDYLRRWKGTRHDSGDPFKYAEKILGLYEFHGIDAKEKVIVFSDGLDVDLIIKLAERFQDKINVSFGIGTNLTNDIGIKPLSLVIKAVRVGHHGLVKLSDNVEKAIGKPEDIQRMKLLVGYNSKFTQNCKY